MSNKSKIFSASAITALAALGLMALQVIGYFCQQEFAIS